MPSATSIGRSESIRGPNITGSKRRSSARSIGPSKPTAPESWAPENDDFLGYGIAFLRSKTNPDSLFRASENFSRFRCVVLSASISRFLFDRERNHRALKCSPRQGSEVIIVKDDNLSLVNEKQLRQLGGVLAEVLQEVLRRRFYGAASVEIVVHDGTIQQFRYRIERVEK
jgi:hypothetical protein